MKDSKVVQVLHDHGFWGADLSIVSKLKRPDYYGIELTREARAALGYTQKGLKSLPQVDRMIAYMERMGSITSWEAMNVLGILSPTKRISEIRRMPGIIVHQKRETSGNASWCRWWIEREEEK